MTYKVRIDFTFPSEKEFFEFMSELDNNDDIERLEFTCRVHELEDNENK